MTFKDQLHRDIAITGPIQRIVSLVPSQTELLADLDLEASLVGVTKFCVHPEHIRSSSTVVGGTKTVKIDKIKALKPDIVCCNKEENTRLIIEELNAFTKVHVSNVNSLDDCFELIGMYGELFDVTEKANVIIATIKKERDLFRSSIVPGNTGKVAYVIWKNPWMVAGSDTFINYMLEEANLENVFASSSRYPEISLDDERLRHADCIYLSSEPFPFKKEHKDYIQYYLPEIPVKIVDGEAFSWFGSRLIRSYSYFRNLHS